MTLLQPDGRAGRAELRLRRGRHRRRRSRSSAASSRAQRRRRSATSGVDLIRDAALRPAADLDRRRARARLAGRRSRRSAPTATLTTLDRRARRRSRSARSPRRRSIKELGTNGGGFFNVNSAHPFENPTALSNFVEMLLILAHPGGARPYTYGRMVGSRRQGWAIFAAMVVAVRRRRRRRLRRRGGTARPAHRTRPATQRAATSRARSCASGSPTRRSGPPSRPSPRAAPSTPHESRCTGLGGAGPDGRTCSSARSSSAASARASTAMLLFVLLAVFIAGLMVGRTPEYLGKKIEAREIKLVVARRRSSTPLIGAGRDRARDRRPSAGSAVDLRLRAAGLLRDALRLHVAGQQQRLGVRRLHGLPAAERHEPRRVRHHVRRRPAAAWRCSSAASCRCWPRSRIAGVAGRQAGHPARPGHAAHRHADLRRRPGLRRSWSSRC